MMSEDANDVALRSYFDALLQEPAKPLAVQEGTGTTWQSCRLGRLQLLLPDVDTGMPMGTSQVGTVPTDWHLAHVRIGKNDWHVLDLARSIAPRLACPAVDTLLPVTGTHWLLALPGRPTPMSLPDDAVEWRTQRSSRPWLAGMSRDGQHMALDIHALIAHVVGRTDANPEERSP